MEQLETEQLTPRYIVEDDHVVLRRDPNPNDPDLREEDVLVPVDTLAGAKAGPVRITRPDGSTEVRPPYGATELRRIVRQGYEAPRPLPAVVAVDAFTNQVRADEDLAHMEKWAADGFCVPEGDR